MFFELSKFLNFFLSPPTWILLLLVGSFLFKRKRLKKISGYLCLFVFLFFTNDLLVEYIKYQTIRKYNVASIQPEKKYKLALVMGGFANMNKQTGVMQYTEDRADRLWEAVRLWRSGIVERILITGDGTSFIQDDGTSTADLFYAYMEAMGVPKEAFLLEQKAKNTHQNAFYTQECLVKLHINITDCLLITSATHMERSLKCFAKLEMEPDFYPVNLYNPPEQISHRSFYPTWKAAVKWQELLNEWLGNVIYRIMGYS